MKTATLRAPRKKSGSVQFSKNGAHAAHEMIRRVQIGLPFRELETLRRDLGLTLEQMGEKLGFARATLHRRKISGRLTPDESDKVTRFAQLFRLAAEVFDGKENAKVWLNFPQYALGGAVPLNYARTEVGARVVDNLLGAIEHGVYT